MTLLLSLANSEATIMLADRRLTLGNIPTTEESNKLTIFVCDNARTAVGFTGLADDGAGFHTGTWLAEALMEAGEDAGFRFGSSLDRLAALASSRFAAISMPAARKRLTIALAGYVYHEQPPRGVLACVSNFEHLDCTDSRRSEASPTFGTTFWTEVRPSARPYAVTMAYGATSGLKRHPPEPLRRMLEDGRPTMAVRDRGLSVIDELAAAEGEPGPIGRQCGSVVVWRDLSKEPVIDYHSGKNAWRIELPGVVVSTSTGGAAIRGVAFFAADPSTTVPMLTAKVGRNQPCPCGSGKKYKHCVHQRRRP
ncbi:MAG: hypothetical protein E6G27_05075 [Actinobacteria bacterium]|nr:MAG: hypothetical protein E6G27_05075 [Actinomycetota bacterium]